MTTSEDAPALLGPATNATPPSQPSPVGQDPSPVQQQPEQEQPQQQPQQQEAGPPAGPALLSPPPLYAAAKAQPGQQLPAAAAALHVSGAQQLGGPGPGSPSMLPPGTTLLHNGLVLPVVLPPGVQPAAGVFPHQLQPPQALTAAAAAAAAARGDPLGQASPLLQQQSGALSDNSGGGGQLGGEDGSISSPSLHSASKQSLTESERAAASGSAASSNKALYLGNLHPFVTEEVLQEVFAGLGGITELKVIRDKGSNISAGYGFAKFSDHGSAAAALARVNKVVLFGQEVRVNWAFQKELKTDSASYVHVFVGDLSSDITDAMLFQAFESLPGCSDARVMWDHATGRSRGYGFVSFRTREEAEQAIQSMHGHFVGSKRVRCGWAQHKTDNIVQMDPQILDRVDPTNTNVYVGNLAPHLTEANVKRQFSVYGAVAEVKLHRKGAYGFVRFETHEDAVRAIVCMNGQVLGGKQLKCSWGRHPNTPPQGVQSSLMALAAAASVGGPLGPGGVAPPPLGPGPGPGMAGASPQALHMGMHMGMPMAGSAAQSIIQGQGGPLNMVAGPGLLTPEGDLPGGMHALPMDPSMYGYGMFFGGQQIR